MTFNHEHPDMTTAAAHDTMKNRPNLVAVPTHSPTRKLCRNKRFLSRLLGTFTRKPKASNLPSKNISVSCQVQRFHVYQRVDLTAVCRILVPARRLLVAHYSPPRRNRAAQLRSQPQHSRLPEDSDPLSYSVEKNHTAWLAGPLNCALRNASDPDLVELLLDFGAHIDASGVDGRTPLMHAARTDNVPFALLVLENGAKINAVSTAGQTPLTTAIINNSHRLKHIRRLEYDTSNHHRVKKTFLQRHDSSDEKLNHAFTGLAFGSAAVKMEEEQSLSDLSDEEDNASDESFYSTEHLI
ncbi:hypothetical protein B0H66DRAFT_644566 [Apodospora peruviana]|uniref:Uncharacterized protein n=1 Tax=Apodospora peruviana TaxID=516989 RepID=A0AAE0HTJ1_9PEZI|nr:hypothetical protein B0H66DRAFT_644566 [Apodospora peruviana]